MILIYFLIDIFTYFYIANVSHLGSTIKSAPKADIEDGCCDLLVILLIILQMYRIMTAQNEIIWIMRAIKLPLATQNNPFSYKPAPC